MKIVGLRGEAAVEMGRPGGRGTTLLEVEGGPELSLVLLGKWKWEGLLGLSWLRGRGAWRRPVSCRLREVESEGPFGRCRL